MPERHVDERDGIHTQIVLTALCEILVIVPNRTTTPEPVAHAQFTPDTRSDSSLLFVHGRKLLQIDDDFVFCSPGQQRPPCAPLLLNGLGGLKE